MSHDGGPRLRGHSAGPATSPEAEVEAHGPVAARLPGAWPRGFASGARDRDALLVLAHLETMTPREIHALAWREGSAARCLEAVRRGAIASEGDRLRAAAVDIARVRRALSACGARLVAPGDERYPAEVLELPDPPGWLFVRGDLGPGRRVAIVGARSCSAYGREVAEAIGAGLAAFGIAVVSGGARGVDGAAHRGALRGGGRTVAVLGSGIDVPYPREHRRLLDDIVQGGAVVSEYPPGAPPRQRRFPARNRIVAALARLVVVVEGASGSGSLITAEFAQDLHRDVVAVPGPVTSELSEAPHELIRDGAGLVRDARDVLETLGLEGEPGNGESGPAPCDALSEALSEEEGRVLAALTGTPVVVEEVASRADLHAGAALRILVALELRGLVGAEGGRYRRVPARRPSGVGD